MKAFSKLTTVNEIIDYQKRVLSRTGGRTPEEAQLYHYTNIKAMNDMIESGYMWLGPVDNMNDILEAEIIHKAGIDDFYFSCFSRTNQNIAMFKMYAPYPSGVMISISLTEAKKMLEQKPLLVDRDKTTDKVVDTKLYWTSVCYKDIESNKITTPGQENRRINKPLMALAGAIKLSGWEYEKEVRLCGMAKLYPGQRLAVKLPEKVNVVLCPGFDRTKYRKELAALKAKGIEYEISQYDNWVNY